MKMHTLGHLAMKHARNHFAEEVYLTYGYDITKSIVSMVW